MAEPASFPRPGVSPKEFHAAVEAIYDYFRNLPPRTEEGDPCLSVDGGIIYESVDVLLPDMRQQGHLGVAIDQAMECLLMEGGLKRRNVTRYQEVEPVYDEEGESQPLPPDVGPEDLRYDYLVLEPNFSVMDRILSAAASCEAEVAARLGAKAATVEPGSTTPDANLEPVARASAPERAGEVEPSAPPAPPDQPAGEPKEYLFGWPEITAALKQKNDEKLQKRIKGLDQKYPSPIIFGGSGQPPKVGHNQLVEWWNGLEDQWRELDTRDQDRRATVSESHPYGRDGEVIPGINGHVRHSRSAGTD